MVKQAYDDANWDAFGEHMTDGKSHNNAGMDKVGEEYHGGSQRENIGSTLQWWNWNGQLPQSKDVGLVTHDLTVSGNNATSLLPHYTWLHHWVVGSTHLTNTFTH